MGHKLLDEYIDEDEWYQKTTHPKIIYETLVETFVVDLGDGAECEVYGRDRFKRAVEIADFIWPEFKN